MEAKENCQEDAADHGGEGGRDQGVDDVGCQFAVGQSDDDSGLV